MTVQSDKKVSSRTEAANLRRERILDTALSLFSERGVEGTTMKMLAERAGISAGLTYHYFRSKAELLDRVIEFRGVTFPDLTGRHGDSLDDVVYDFADQFGKSLRQNIDVIWLFYREYRSSKTVAERIGRRRDACVKSFSAYLEARQAAGEVRNLSTLVASRSLLGSLFHLHLAEVPTDEFVQELVEIFLTGIRK